MIIAIDGPAGTGKTTIARGVAQRLGFTYFDTGAMYRAVTWAMLQKNISVTDSRAIAQLLAHFSFSIKGHGNEKRYFVEGTDVTQAIRSREVTGAVSEVSALAAVRESLLKIQRAFAKTDNCVFEGRDIGSVVFPKAEIKIFLTARPEVRAERRLKEFLQKNPQEASKMDHKTMLEEIQRRDDFDSSREIAPLKCPEDAHVVDTSDLSIDQVIEEILKYAL